MLGNFINITGQVYDPYLAMSRLIPLSLTLQPIGLISLGADSKIFFLNFKVAMKISQISNLYCPNDCVGLSPTRLGPGRSESCSTVKVH